MHFFWYNKSLIMTAKCEVNVMKQVMRRMMISVLLVVGLLAVIMLYSFFIGGCVIRNLTNIPCPTCGMTRAAFAFASFRFSDAFAAHPLIFFLVPLVLVIGVLYIFFDVKPTDNRYIPIYIITLIIFLIVWLIRLIFFSIP
jgi:hypothetical protein